ncbi:MAG: SMC family ATPase [Candidatus Poribacteria bacterium]
MKLHWVELENWRQHDKTKIEFDERTTVIYGPNEAGKSTIFEALSKGFFDRSSSQAETIRRIKPLTASGSVTSTVRIEFTINQTKYRVEKNFNIKSGTSLYRIDGEKSILIDQDTADEKLIGLLEAELPSPRGSKPSQWGAFHWLWANQDNRDLPNTDDGDPTVVLHLETSGDLLVTPKFKAVQERIQSDYAKYFTNTGRETKDSPIPKLKEDIQNLEKSALELKEKIKKVDGEKQQLEGLKGQFPDLEKKLVATKSELEKVRSEAVDLSSIESELKASNASVNETERDVKDAQTALKELHKAESNIDSIRKEEKETQGNYSRLDALRDQLEKQFQDKDNEIEGLDGLADKIRNCEELTRDARILKDSADTMKSIAELSEKIERITKINEEIEVLKKREIPIIPTDKEIDSLIQKQIHIEVLRENLKVSGISVSVIYGESGSLEVEVDGEKLSDREATATENVKVKSYGLGEITIKANLDQARDAKSNIINLEKDIQGVLSKYGSNSVNELKEMNSTQKAISNKIKELTAEKRGIDKRSLDEMILERQSLNSRYEGYKKLERKPFVVELNATESNLAELVKKREFEEDKTRKVLDEARKEREKIKEGLSQKKEELATIGTKLKYCEVELDKAITQERELIRKYGSEENQDKKLLDAQAELKKRKEKHEQIEKRYEELEKGSENKIKRLVLQIEGQDQIVRQHKTSIDKLETVISIESLDGAYSRLSDTESQIEVFKERLEREQIRSDSLKLLKESLENQYRKALSVVVGPIQDDVRHSLSYVTGFLHEDVELNEYLFPTKLGERGIEDISLEFNDGSSGLKELLAICVRLAVAKHLSERDSQCLVLDDPFVHVSSDRSNRMIELINEAMGDHGLQVIILTHRQMEFAGLSGKMVDIQSAKRG